MDLGWPWFCSTADLPQRLSERRRISRQAEALRRYFSRLPTRPLGSRVVARHHFSSPSLLTPMCSGTGRLHRLFSRSSFSVFRWTSDFHALPPIMVSVPHYGDLLNGAAARVLWPAQRGPAPYHTVQRTCRDHAKEHRSPLSMDRRDYRNRAWY